MWSADVAALSADGWQPNEDAVVMRSQRLVANVPPDTVEQCRPGIGASSYIICLSVSLSISLSVCRHISKPSAKTSQNFPYLITAAVAWQYVMYFRSCGPRCVFTQWDRYRYTLEICDVASYSPWLARWRRQHAHPGRSLLSPSALLRVYSESVDLPAGGELVELKVDHVAAALDWYRVGDDRPPGVLVARE